MAYVENAPHNPEVVGSNPAPATKNLQLVGLAGELFSCVLIGCFWALRPWVLELPDFVLREPAQDGAFSGAWRDSGHLGHLGDVSCCKATMSRQENDAVALEVAHECGGAKRSSFCW